MRGQQWVVARTSSSQPADELAEPLPGRTLVTLTSVSDEDLGEELTVVWEVELGREALPEALAVPRVNLLVADEVMTEEQARAPWMAYGRSSGCAWGPCRG